MNTPKYFNGYDLVAKGITKIQASLPERGLKEVQPTGSRLEEEQIQSAVEARKQLLEAERIEKSGILSCAEWREDLNLAEVTQKLGGHWQFMGHNVGKKLFLYPEEALFLMEVNSLLLKYNDVKVSLQQGYSLLLKDESSRIQFQVYASLSRVGYKVLRHKYTKTLVNVNDSDHTEEPSSNTKTVNVCDFDDCLSHCKNNTNGVTSNIIQDNPDEDQDKGVTRETKFANSVLCEGSQNFAGNPGDGSAFGNSKQQYETSIYQSQIKNLMKRMHKTKDAKNLQIYFDNLSNLLHNQIVSIKVPERALIPDNIFFNKSEYMVNLQSVKNRCLRPTSTGSKTYIGRGEVFVDSRRNWNEPNLPCIRFDCHNSLIKLNRPTFNNYSHGYRSNCSQSSKRSIDHHAKSYYYETLKGLATRTRNVFLSGYMQPLNVGVLNKLIHTYNNLYNSRLKLSDDFKIVDERIVDTITLDDDEDVRRKRPRLDDRYDTYNINLNSIKELAKRLRDIERNDRPTAQNRRAFSNLIKAFNKSYKTDIYITSNFEVFDKNHITLDCSSSDSDCVVVKRKKATRRTKLWNPFNIIKRFQGKFNKSINEPSTSSELFTRFDENSVSDKKYSDTILKNFSKNWLPDENNFGKPEIVSVNTLNKVTRPGNFIYTFMKCHYQNCENWLDLKIAFLNYLEKTKEVFQNETDSEKNSCCTSIITHQDCIDTPEVLKKLSIIKSADRATSETNMMIHYDVYNRDVKNFKKTNPPAPHFRVSCLDESSHFPGSKEIASLHARYEDTICIVFAVVGEGSISYLQIKPTSLPMYISSHDNNIP